jgi:hypothetical protein
MKEICIPIPFLKDNEVAEVEVVVCRSYSCIVP